MDLLIDKFLTGMQDACNKATSNTAISDANKSLLVSSLRAITQAIRVSDRVYFEESTMRMLSSKLQHYTDTIEEITSTYGKSVEEVSSTISRARGSASWIQYKKPINEVAAIFSFIPSLYVETGREQVQLYLVDGTAQVLQMFWCQVGKDWRYDPGYHPCSRCEHIGNEIIPCSDCEAFLILWQKVVSMTMIISGLLLAERRYEEKTFSGIRHMPRRKNDKKAKRVPVSYVFRVIDASEIIIPVRSEPTPTRQSSNEKNSWVAEAETLGVLGHKEIQTRPFERTYRHERYKNVKGQVLKFPEGVKRSQPIRTDREHATKVKASLYEN
jgi:hypothetical protein